MIGFLSGSIREKNPIIIDVSGVGYLVHIPERLEAELHINGDCRLYIHTHVREDALDLYGFLTKEELMLFELLLTVSGIGPKTSMSIINFGVAAIQKAVNEGDVDFFTMIPRLGRKNAQKIIIELKSKLGSVTDLNLSLEHGETKDVLDVLLSMGFAKHEAMEAIKKLSDTEMSLEQKIRRSLQLLARK